MTLVFALLACYYSGVIINFHVHIILAHTVTFVVKLEVIALGALAPLGVRVQCKRASTVEVFSVAAA